MTAATPPETPLASVRQATRHYLGFPFSPDPTCRADVIQTTASTRLSLVYVHCSLELLGQWLLGQGCWDDTYALGQHFQNSGC